MPVFTTPITQQNQAGTSGIIGYPAIGSMKQFIIFSDEFNREVVNPTNAVALYTTVNNAGTGATTIANQDALQIATTASSNDDNDTRISGVGFARVANYIDLRTTLIFDIIFTTDTAIANQQFFVGIIDSNTSISGLPTTTRHLGVYLDTSVDNDLRLSSANGTTQVKTDIGVATASKHYRLNINWNGDDSATLTLYIATGSPQVYTSVLGTQTVTSLANGANFLHAYELHGYNKTLTTAAKKLFLEEWACTAQ